MFTHRTSTRKGKLPSLKLTASWHLKIDDLKAIVFSAYFQGLLLLASGKMSLPFQPSTTTYLFAVPSRRFVPTNLSCQLRTCRKQCRPQRGDLSEKSHHTNNTIWVFPKIVVLPNHPLKNRVFHYKPSILGVFPLFSEISIFAKKETLRRNPSISLLRDKINRSDLKFFAPNC